MSQGFPIDGKEGRETIPVRVVVSRCKGNFMKAKSVVLGVFVSAAVTLAALSHAQESKSERQHRRQANFMSEKRVFSQLALEGLMMDQPELVVEYGTKMWNATEGDVWQRLFRQESKNPRFIQYSVEFRGNVQSMINAAKEKNPDAAMEAYKKSLQSCYDCHKHVRSQPQGGSAAPASSQ
jgi:cytochrome c556